MKHNGNVTGRKKIIKRVCFSRRTNKSSEFFDKNQEEKIGLERGREE